MLIITITNSCYYCNNLLIRSGKTKMSRLIYIMYYTIVVKIQELINVGKTMAMIDGFPVDFPIHFRPILSHSLFLISDETDDYPKTDLQ